MLKALFGNKLGRVLSSDALPDDGALRDRVRRSEDALTATVFERLLYLAPQRAATILEPALDGEAKLFGPEYPKATFWPRFQLGSSHVEPDLVLEYEDRVVVVEVKWGQPHHVDQWKRELSGAAAKFGDDRELHMVLVGRSWQRRWALGALETFVSEAAGTLERRIAGGWISWESLHARLERASQADLAAWEYALVRDVRDILTDRGLRVREHLGSLRRAPISTTPKDLNDRWPLVRADGSDALHPHVASTAANLYSERKL